jgi:hypothetical protein
MICCKRCSSTKNPDKGKAEPVGNHPVYVGADASRAAWRARVPIQTPSPPTARLFMEAKLDVSQVPAKMRFRTHFDPVN